MKMKSKSIFIVLTILFILFPILSSNYILVSQDIDFEDEFDELIDDFLTSFNDPTNPLSLSINDVKFVQGEKYIDLFVRKREEINSILIIYVVEGTVDGEKVNIDYGLRALEYNKINGDEIRVLNGVELGKEQGLYFLIDSTPESNSYFGEAFQVRIPTYTQYGYTKEEFGLVRVEEGTKIKIRAFELPYADYSGEFHDNVFTVDTSETEKPVEVSGEKPLVYLDPSVNYNLTQTEDERFIIAYVMYEDNSRFFKDFLVRTKPLSDDMDSPYMSVSFKVEDIPEDNKAILLSSIYQNGKKVVRAKFYFKRERDYKIIQISARDEHGNQPLEPLEIEVPRLGESLDYNIEVIPGYSLDSDSDVIVED